MSKLIGHIVIPVYALGDRELAGLRQTMMDAGPHDISCGAGLGSDGIWMGIGDEGKTHKDYLLVLGRDILARALEVVQHEDAGRVPTSAQYDKQPTDGVYRQTGGER